VESSGVTKLQIPPNRRKKIDRENLLDADVVESLPEGAPLFRPTQQKTVWQNHRLSFC
jgi:hypothetical protein